MAKKTIRRSGDWRREAREEPEEAPQPETRRQAPPQPAPPRTAPRLETQDLEDLARMDPSEIASLLDASVAQRRVEPGDKVTGRITRITKDAVFVEVGAKSEGILARIELREEAVGDEIEAFVLHSDEQGIQLSRRLSGAAAGSFLAEAAETGVPVQGRVIARNPGGYQVMVGAVRGFCPVSHIDRLPARDPDVYVGHTYDFKVLQADGEPVLSRRAAQDAALEETRERFWKTAKPGDTFSGTVTSVQAFGVFVDVEGVDGLVHKSELSWEEADPTRFERGQVLEVRVLEVDAARQRLSLSAKDPSASPWSRVGSEFVEGGVYEGTVTGVAQYGAFVRLAPGLEGLLHGSRHAGALPKVGQRIEVRIAGVDPERRRLELADPGFRGEASADESAWRDHRPQREQSLGTLGDLLEGWKKS